MTREETESRLRRDEGGPLLAYLELLRIPNVFTAIADVAMGLLFVRAVIGWPDAALLGLLALASSLLYAAGVVLNDVFDYELDLRERPERPLPSGRVSLEAARRTGWALLLAGVSAAWAAALLAGSVTLSLVALLLAGAIVAYNAVLKPTLLGPPAMGACRMLNVLLGMSLLAEPWRGEHWLVAGAIGVYVTGVTCFARSEARRSPRPQLAFGLAVMLSGVALLAWLPQWSDRFIPLLKQQPQRWQLLMAVCGAVVGWRCLLALVEPAPQRVRMAVAVAILSLVVLDAAVVYAIRDAAWAVAILLLVVPAMFFARWIETT